MLHTKLHQEVKHPNSIFTLNTVKKLHMKVQYTKLTPSQKTDFKQNLDPYININFFRILKQKTHIMLYKS